MKPTPTRAQNEAAKRLYAELKSVWRAGYDRSVEERDIALIAAALSVPAAAVVGEPEAAYHVKVKGWGEELCFTEDGANSLVKRLRRTKGQDGEATITPLYATLPNEALERSEQATFDIAARLLKERDALASRISQQDAELERMRREVEEVRADKARLDFLDECNARLNAHHNTVYGWEMVMNHNVNRLMIGYLAADLNDAKAHGFKSCRGAIDEEIKRIEAARAAHKKAEESRT